MTRFCDKVGFGIPAEVSPGVWSDIITERVFIGDILTSTRAIEASDKVNNNVRLQQRISIMADAWALQNVSMIRYVSWAGSLWLAESVSIERPRLVITMGGVYDGPRPAP